MASGTIGLQLAVDVSSGSQFRQRAEEVNIYITERQFSLRSEYDIAAPGRDYYAEKKWLSFAAKIQLLSEDRQLLGTIRGRFPFGPRYDFEFANGRIYRFWCEGFWKSVYRCDRAEEKYRIYQHKGLNFSIFRDDRQIAAFSKNRVAIGKGNEYAIRLDDDADSQVVICMVLAINTSQGDNDTSVTIDFGSIGPEDRPFDASWEPR